MTSDVAFPGRFTEIDELTRPEHSWLADDELQEGDGSPGEARVAVQGAGDSTRGERVPARVGHGPAVGAGVRADPASKTRNNLLYDDRVTRMLRAIGPDGTVDVRELIIQTKSTDAVHSRQTRPTPPQIQDQYRIDEALTIPDPRSSRLWTTS